ncbi:response regulator [Aggregicoccus sp. 17bor-14]|uniref:response regulator n=1 Tax=Myxococcaceae TaxID=31 RepID=UPI00129C1F01|nr:MULTISPECIES: response regulator [Myxococcaceae]MBF5046270.1 response regulator [Simulacricoccus sp. 17bor-14]MRI91992.1 response regulator [Aggregicoccus sp. 17bor-14]
MTEPAHNAPQVLVVDDDADLRQAVCELLEDEGYRVQTAQHGAAALALLRASSTLPQLILLDLMMPVMDGWQFREAQAADPRLARIPVVVLTASRNLHDSPPLQVDALAYKPVQLEQLLHLVQAHAGQAPPGPAQESWDAHAP